MSSLLTLLAATLLAQAPQPIAVEVPASADRVSYAKQVADVLAARCLGCHNAADRKGKLSLEDVAGMTAGGKRGPALVPGKAVESRMFLFASHQAEPNMPPADAPRAEPLTPKELGLLKLWIDQGAVDDSGDAATPEPVALGALPDGLRPIVAVDLSDDGRRVAAGRGNVVEVYDAESGACLAKLEGHQDIIQSLRFSPDGRYLAAGSYEIVTIWLCPVEGESKDEPGTWRLWRTLGPHADRVTALDFNPDGTLLAVGAGEPSRGGEVTLWETGKGLRVRRLDGLHSDTVFGLRFDPEGTRLATASADKLVKIVEVGTGRELKALEGHTNHVLGVDWNGNGRQIVSAGADGVLKFWDAQAGEALRTSPPADSPLNAVRWARGGGNLVATASGNKEVRFWNANNLQVARRFETGAFVYGVAVSADRGRVLAGDADGALFLWNGANGQLIRKFEAP